MLTPQFLLDIHRELEADLIAFADMVKANERMLLGERVEAVPA